MEMIRNSINVVGLANEEDLQAGLNGHIIKYSEVETLLLPSYKSEAKCIKEVKVNVTITSKRLVTYPDGKLLIISGLKELKVKYTENSPEEMECVASIQSPYYTVSEINLDTEKNGSETVGSETEGIVKVNTHVLDAYFHKVDPRKISAHFVYLIEILWEYEQEDQREEDYDLMMGNEEIYLPDNSIIDQQGNLLFDLDEEIL